ncbi:MULTISPECIES: phosphoribosylanthranilate isomerase [unclassified Cellulophaga]|uniref:phosphoribosylanthranilate isomerase n=1 Tax=unclassified Cellulophaga TaxID=2634405 RepID=UPI0026E26FB0|nr:MULTISPECIES: phosphoribosylanthranilate isomerase [unclassified Cellulophaga]MDO6492759.1 phosphoribosylanthranilate isomerase [Cellulophaga sp. 2_MG-2023]MDO6496281.1 phosphoribosylanthranilate isomerase [Cellulophaga sp. 3_MG-2023]
MKLKVCGMKYLENMEAVATLQPDFLGFIFWEPSSRFFNGKMGNIPKNIKKVGVFVDADLDYVVDRINQYNLDIVQLHGKESPEFCKGLRNSNLGLKGKQPQIIKVFSIKDSFDFSILAPFEKVCDYFLFDTKGKLPGGNGYTFNWSVLENYPSTKPYFLSGGIGVDDVYKIKEFFKTTASKYCVAIDVNSSFETEPGLKNIEKLKEFKTALSI